MQAVHYRTWKEQLLVREGSKYLADPVVSYAKGSIFEYNVGITLLLLNVLLVTLRNQDYSI